VRDRERAERRGREREGGEEGGEERRGADLTRGEER
jgi:hypothetical protein